MSDIRKARSEARNKWKDTFPETFDTAENSKNFVLRFISVAVCMILKKRGIVPADAFKDRNTGSVKIAWFNTNNPYGMRMLTKMLSLKDALKSNYLREFALVFYRLPDEENIVEVYSFKIRYDSDNAVSLSMCSGIQTKEANENLISFKFKNNSLVPKTFHSMILKLHRYVKCLDAFEDGMYDASFRVNYTEETPDYYCPVGYEKHQKMYEFPADSAPICMGSIGGTHCVTNLMASSLFLKKNFDINESFDTLNNTFRSVETNNETLKKTVDNQSEKKQKVWYFSEAYKIVSTPNEEDES